MLLAIAVILPAVCLLWFMTQAVKNERLAIRQKLIDSYTARAQEIFLKNIQIPINDQNEFSAYTIYDQNDKIIYPVQSSQRIIYSSDSIQKVWKLEYSDANYVEAIKEYDKRASFSSIPDEVYECQMGVIRCLIKQGKFDDAIKICLEFAYPGKHIINEFTPEQIARAKLMLVNLYTKVNHKALFSELQNQLSDTDKTAVPTETKIFILGEFIKIAQESGLDKKFQTEIKAAQKFIDSASLSIIAADYLNQNTVLSSQQDEVFFKIPAAPPMYAIYLKTDDKKTLALLTTEKMSQLWQKSIDDFTDKLVFCRIYDESGQQIAGEPKIILGGEVVSGSVFSTLNLKDCFAGWKVELYLRAGVFQQAADKKMLVYIWVAGAVIFLMLASTFFAGSAVLKQAKLNKLKNDFIATITHELKTPLASMRILVDTLLDEKCQSRQQEIEYLQLISKENARLSRLIDNFLTFSRMERDKQAFDFASASPVEIANNAAEAMQAKFEKSNVRFSLNVLKPLPMIEADKDAMITVLVNLLDNAFKYSGENKEITLNVFVDNQSVCFSVRDNGIGLTRRQIKKVFDKFYQVDNSLSRKVEGTGLGLSIVKFIVNAHKGKIDVESKIGKGSEFKIKILWKLS